MLRRSLLAMLKVQTGVSYVSLNGTPSPNTEYHAWQWTTGLRLSF